MRQRETPGSPKFIEPEDRIAAFDQDGTTRVEQASYAPVMFAFHQLGVIAAKWSGWHVVSMKNDWKRIFAWEC
jgi:hypothetical protein